MKELFENNDPDPINDFASDMNESKVKITPFRQDTTNKYIDTEDYSSYLFPDDQGDSPFPFKSSRCCYRC